MKILYSCKNLKYGLFFFIFLTFASPVYAGNDNLNELSEELAETSLDIPTTHRPLPEEQPTSPVEEIDNDDSNTNTSPALQLATMYESQPTTTETEGTLTVITRRRASLERTGLAYQRAIRESIQSFQRTLRDPHLLPEFLSTPLGRVIYQEVGRYLISTTLSSADLSPGLPRLPWRTLSEISDQAEDLETVAQHPRSLVIPLFNIPFLPSFNFTIQEPQENRRSLSHNGGTSFPEVDGEERDNIFFSFQKMAFNFAYKTSELYEQYSLLLSFTFFLCYFIKIFHN